MPRVSVVMPCLSSARFLEEAIDSIMEQTLRDIELLIVLDPGSTDDTEDILDGCSDERVRIIRNDVPMGLVRSLNRGFALSKSEYIARMDADDASLPHRLERQSQFLDQNPTVGVVGSAVEEIDEYGHALGIREYPTTTGMTVWKMHLYCAMCHPATMLRKKVFQEIGGYSVSAKYGEDYDLWLRAMRYYDLTSLPDVLLKYRVHSGSICSQMNEKQRELMVERAGRAIDLTIGRPVLRDYVRSMIFPYTIENRKNAIGAAWLLTGLKRSYLNWYKGRTWDDTLNVKRETAARMSHIMTRSVKVAPTAAPMVAWQASRCGPGVAVRLGNQMVERAKDVLGGEERPEADLNSSRRPWPPDNRYMHPP